MANPEWDNYKGPPSRHSMSFSEYSDKATTTAVYPKPFYLFYPALALCGEAGEVAEKVKKLWRDNDGVVTDEIRESIKLELGDVLWYIAALANDLGVSLEDVARSNLQKLEDRTARNKLQGSGDNR